MRIVDEEDAPSDQFSMSVVGKPMNSLAPIVASSQLFQGQSRTLRSSHVIQVSDEKQIVSVAISAIAGRRKNPLIICDVPQRNYFTPTELHIVSAVCTRDHRDTCVHSIVLQLPLTHNEFVKSQIGINK
jgi:hypothetical protein